MFEFYGIDLQTTQFIRDFNRGFCKEKCAKLLSKQPAGPLKQTSLFLKIQKAN